MWALGDKIASSIVAQTAGVPTMPWSGSGILTRILPCLKDTRSKSRKTSYIIILNHHIILTLKRNIF